MQIDNPEEILISESLNKTLVNIQKGISELNARDLTKKDREKILEALMVPQIRKSLGIEGIRASVRQTQDVLDFYRIEGEIREGKDAQAIINLQEANNFICSDEAINSPLTTEFIKKVHFLVTNNTGVKNPGEFKTEPNHYRTINNKPVATALPMMVEECLENISVYFEASNNQDPIMLACWLHHQISKVHPFADGNGRTARTLQDWVLYKNKYLPCSTGSIDRLRYYDILEGADEGDWEEFISQVAEAQSDSLAIAEESLFTSEKAERRRFALFKSLDKQKTEVSNEEYEAWRYQATRLISAFEQECNIYKEKFKESGVFGIQFYPETMISLDKWKAIKSDGFANKNNAFRILFWKENDLFFKTVGYFAKHFVRDSDVGTKIDKKDLPRMVSLYLGGHDEPHALDFPAKARKIYDKRGRSITELPSDDPHVAYREILFNSKNFYKYRNASCRWIQEALLEKDLKLSLDSDHEHWIVDDTDPQDSASQYLFEMFKYKGGLE